MKRIVSTVIPKGNRMAPKKTTSAQATTKKAVKKPDSGETEPVYKQFKNKPVEAIRHLIKVKKGVAKDALYRKEVGYVSIPWGKNVPKTNKGYGLKHIIEKHGWEFDKMGFPIELAIISTFSQGDVVYNANRVRFIFESEKIRVVVSSEINSEKQILITSYSIDPKKNPRT